MLSKLILIFKYFLSWSSEFLILDLFKSLIVLHSSSYFFFFTLLVGTSVKYLFLLFYSKYVFTFLKGRYKGFPLYIFYVFRIFYRHISNLVNNNIFTWLFIYFNIIWIKIFYTDNIIEKVVCAVFLYLYLWLYYSF